LKKGIILVLIVFGLAACSQKAPVGIRKDIFNAGVDYVQLMQQNVKEISDDSIKEVDASAQKYTDIATIQYDYNEFSKDEKEFTDDLGNLRIAVDDAMFDRDPKVNVNVKITEQSLKKFENLIQKFENKYKVSIH
jgi:DNA-binding transcriptional regulator GbsR (MarR family)